VLVVGACTRSSDGNAPNKEYAHALSPDAEVSAYVYHYDSDSGGLTQVILDFVGLGCGSGSAAWYDYDIGVELRWIDSETLEVTYPGDKHYEHNVGGDLLGCFDRSVRVVMVPSGQMDLAGRRYEKPVEIGRTPSPDGDFSAYTFRYGSPKGGITQVIVHVLGDYGCEHSAVTFYDNAIDLQLNWIDTAKLEIRFPDGQRYDLPPWGTTVSCVGQAVHVKMQPTTHVPESLSLQR
jgi:hypothetical protein